MSQALTRATLPPCYKLMSYKAKFAAEDDSKCYVQHPYVIYRCAHCRKWHRTFVK